MGRIYEALQRSSASKLRGASPIAGASPMVDLGFTAEPQPVAETDAAPDPVSALEHVPVLTVTPTPEQRLVTLNGNRSLGVEKLRIIAARLRHAQEQRPIKKLLITSTVKDEGKTMLSSNIAVSLARMQQRVLLIDGDCHQSKAGSLFGASKLPGLSDWWQSDAGILDYLKRVNALPLWLLPAGKPLDHPVEMLESERVSQLLAQISDWFDWIIIDSPPSGPIADAAVWEKMCDAVLLVVREGTTPKTLLRKVVDSLDSAKLLGIVLNECSDRNQSYYSDYYNSPPKR